MSCCICFSCFSGRTAPAVERRSQQSFLLRDQHVEEQGQAKMDRKCFGYCFSVFCSHSIWHSHLCFLSPAHFPTMPCATTDQGGVSDSLQSGTPEAHGEHKGQCSILPPQTHPEHTACPKPCGTGGHWWASLVCLGLPCPRN